MTFDDNNKEKAWVEVLIIGDSSQGKTEAVKSLLNFYGLGEFVDCKGATEAGLKGGLQKFNERWFITWGKIPNNDRRLVVLDELKGTSINEIGKLTEMRSSGIAQLTKIVQRKTSARTRMIAISNPRKPRPISSYNYGLDAIVEVIGNLEDIRRFDMCLILNKDEIDVDSFRKNRPVINQKYDGNLCRDLILWCWTTHAVFEDENIIFDAAIELCTEFVDAIPIVDRGSMRLKLARLSAGLAGRTFSHNNENNILVRKCHVEFIKDFLHKEYSKESFGYAEYSNAIRNSDKIMSEQAVTNRIFSGTPFPRDFINQIMNTDDVDLQFFQDVNAWDQNTARELLSFLYRQHAIYKEKESKFYKKSTNFTHLLKRIQGNSPTNPENNGKEKF
jgi:hypothetical protein